MSNALMEQYFCLYPRWCRRQFIVFTFEIRDIVFFFFYRVISKSHHAERMYF